MRRSRLPVSRSNRVRVGGDQYPGWIAGKFPRRRPMTSRYHHTQIGILTLIVLTVSAIVCATAAYLAPPSPGRALLWTLALALAVFTGLFSALTVDVTE